MCIYLYIYIYIYISIVAGAVIFARSVSEHQKGFDLMDSTGKIFAQLSMYHLNLGILGEIVLFGNAYNLSNSTKEFLTQELIKRVYAM